MEGLRTFGKHLGTYTESRKLLDHPTTVPLHCEKSTPWYSKVIAFYTIDNTLIVNSSITCGTIFLH